MFSENQIKALTYNLEESRIKTIDKAGMSFKYLETYDVINVANTIFNYMWDYTITRLEEVARETNQNGNLVITYSAILKVKIYDAQSALMEFNDTWGKKYPHITQSWTNNWNELATFLNIQNRYKRLSTQLIL